MGCARRGELNVRVDHKDGSITFVDDPFIFDEHGSPASSSSLPSKEPPIQPSTSELVRTRLSRVAQCLHSSIQFIEQQPQQPPEEESEAHFKALVTAVESERKALQVRRALVARRRELVSELSVRKEKEESSRRAESSRREKEEELRRSKEDLKKREQERARKEIETIRIDEAKKYAQTLVDKGILKQVDVEVRSTNPFPHSSDFLLFRKWIILTLRASSVNKSLISRKRRKR